MWFATAPSLKTSEKKTMKKTLLSLTLTIFALPVFAQQITSTPYVLNLSLKNNISNVSQGAWTIDTISVSQGSLTCNGGVCSKGLKINKNESLKMHASAENPDGMPQFKAIFTLVSPKYAANASNNCHAYLEYDLKTDGYIRNKLNQFTVNFTDGTSEKDFWILEKDGSRFNCE